MSTANPAPLGSGADAEFGKGGHTLLKRLKTKKKKRRMSERSSIYHYEVKVHNYYFHL